MFGWYMLRYTEIYDQTFSVREYIEGYTPSPYTRVIKK